MSLRTQAEADCKAIVEDLSGFGWPITVTDPEGRSASLVGLSADIAHLIDPDSGQAVAGRKASVAMMVSTLKTLGFEIPANISEDDRKPWVVTFADIGGTSHTFKVSLAHPDRGHGIVTCQLEAYFP